MKNPFQDSQVPVFLRHDSDFFIKQTSVFGNKLLQFLQKIL